MNKLTEYQLIKDDEIRAEVRKALHKFPDYFWEIPAATTYNHHNPYACDKLGLWIHTKMVCTDYLNRVPSKVARGILTEREADMGLAACILHDSWKAGKPPVKGSTGATRDHDIIAGRFVEQETDLPQEVADAVKSHMGPWYDGPEPVTNLEEIVHMADMGGSSKNSTPGLYSPHSKITDMYPSIPRANFDRESLYK